MVKVINKTTINPYYFLCTIIGLTILSGLILSATKVSADNTDVVDEINITVPESCTMTGTGMNTHNAEINNNTYTADIGTTTLHAFCNDNGGFAIYAVGYTGNEIGGTNSTKLVGSPSTIGSIDTGTATSGNTSNWAMKLTKTQDSGDTSGTNAFTIDNGFDSSSYHAVPSAYTKVAHKNTATDMTTSTGGVKLTTTYAAFISKTQPAGTYSGQVKYTLVHPATETPLQPVPCTSGKICYNTNGSNVVGAMVQQSAGDNASVTLYPSNFSRQGYGFAGWSTTYDYSDSTGFYGPMETITTPADTSTNGLSLYAIWVKSAGNIQDWSGCSSLASGAVTALSDQRDNNTYAVAKLADGNCWMIENMRLDNANSDNATGALAQGYGTSSTYGNFSGLANPESPWRSDITTANSLYSTDGADNTINIGTSYASARFPRYNNQNTSSRASNPTNSINIYSYGNYYTWSAAIADTATHNTSNQSVTSTSICPSSWHLPTGGGAYASDGTTGVNITGSPNTYREFYNLGYKIMDEVKTAYEDTPNGRRSYYSSNTINLAGDTASKAFRKYPNNFVNSGEINSTSVSDRGLNGSYWSSTAESYNDAYYLILTSTNVYPGTYYNLKDIGRSIRCVTSGT